MDGTSQRTGTVPSRLGSRYETGENPTSPALRLTLDTQLTSRFAWAEKRGSRTTDRLPGFRVSGTRPVASATMGSNSQDRRQLRLGHRRPPPKNHGRIVGRCIPTSCRRSCRAYMATGPCIVPPMGVYLLSPLTVRDAREQRPPVAGRLLRGAGGGLSFSSVQIGGWAQDDDRCPYISWDAKDRFQRCRSERTPSVVSHVPIQHATGTDSERRVVRD